MRLPLRHAARTLLLVGEGETEVAFLNHLKGIYIPRGCGLAVKVLSARGKGPENVVDTVVRQCAYRGFVLRAALLDTDIPWSVEVRRRAEQMGIKMVGSTPCLEGLLLEVLNQVVPRRTADCKRTFKAVFTGNPLRAEDYARQFDRSVLESARQRVVPLRELLELLV